MTESDIAVLILAAGASSRMGQPKALLPWGGTTVMGHLLDELKAAGLSDITLVSGAHHEELKKGLEQKDVRLVYHKGWEAGMGSSLRKGVQFTSESFPQKRGLLILLSDQPLISSDYFKEMVAAFQAHPDRIIATSYGESAGVPALFPSEFWPAMARVADNRGAKALIRSHHEDCVLLDAGAAVTDMDTPEAYREILQKAGLK